MTEGLLVQHEKPMCVRIWLEVGHACEPRRSASGRALSLDWRLWVRGANGNDISTFVHKVVFYLHPASAFVYPKRVRQEPPYEIQESGCASIEVPIHVYLKFDNKPQKISLRYNLAIENNTRSSSESRCIYFDFNNPSDQLWRALMKGGGEVIPRAQHAVRADRLLSDSGDDRPPRAMRPKRYKFVEPVQCKHATKRAAKRNSLDELCPTCGESVHVDFKKHLRAVSMTEDEIARVSQLYMAINMVEDSVDALPLPPLGDPIYRLPELPPSLRDALKGVKIDAFI